MGDYNYKAISLNLVKSHVLKQIQKTKKICNVCITWVWCRQGNEWKTIFITLTTSSLLCCSGS